MTLVTVGDIIVLAFIANSIEFACSAALPAIFTHALALRYAGHCRIVGGVMVFRPELLR